MYHSIIPTGLQSAEFEMPKIWAHDFFSETHILLLFIYLKQPSNSKVVL